MRLRLGRTRTALVIAPHADDEVIGAFGLIRLLRRRGARIVVAVVTDGAGSHPSSRTWPRARLVAARRRESRTALRRLGVPAGAVIFLDLPDGGLSAQGRRCNRSIARLIARQRGLDLLVGPTMDDAHPDHRAVAAAMARVRHRCRRLAYRVWPPVRAGAGSWTLPGDRPASMKRSVIRGYRTQMGAITDDPAGFAIAAHEMAVFAHPVEQYRTVRR